MTDIIDAAELASYLRNPALASDDSFELIVDLTNDLLTEEWDDPVDPVPVKVRLLALNVASRAWVNDPSRSNVESVSRALDDASRTERYRASSERGSVYLTEVELAALNGREVARSLRLVAYGES